MARNKISDLRDHLFAQLERLGDDEAMKNPISRDREIARAKSISEVSQVLVNSVKVEVDYIKSLDKAGITIPKEVTKFISELPEEQKAISQKNK